MAMLAEPRRRKRYNLVPRGKALYEDDNRFGTKMLEKMGWSKGNGLGPEEKGSVDFVRVRYKNDAEGLGFESRDDQWTQHEEGFSGLLSTLNNGLTEAVVKESDTETGVATVGFGYTEKPKKKKKGNLKDKFSGESLEEKSKQSKARVHYKKFTRGKDLSQYSEKDLANIFGKKVLQEDETAIKFNQGFEAIKIDNDNGESGEEGLNTNYPEGNTISSQLSVSDYFKQKMEAKKNALKLKAKDIRDETGIGENTISNSKSTKKRALEDSVMENDDEELIIEPLGKTCEEEIGIQAPKKKKKKSKSKTQGSRNTEEKTQEDLEIPDKKKKSKSRVQETSTLDETPTIVDEGNKSVEKDSVYTCHLNSMEDKIDLKTPVIEQSNNRYGSSDSLITTYKISAFCAEKFRHTDLEQYKSSNLSEIIGYGCSKDLKLEIETVRDDELRINQLWNCTLNKHDNDSQKNGYFDYVKQVRTAFKNKQKPPRLQMKTWKRKAFHGIS